MAKTAMIRARVEPDLKSAAEAVLGKIGLSPTEAIRLFYRQVSLHRGLPFSVRIPNSRTRRALGDIESGRNLTSWADLDELKRASR